MQTTATLNILAVAELSILLVMAAERTFSEWMLAIVITLTALQLALLVTEHVRRSRQAGTAGQSRGVAIDALYTELRQLVARHDPGLEREIERRLARLRELQGEEAEALRQRFEARLHLEPGAGWQALREARRLLAEDEDPTPANHPAARQA